MQNQPVKSVNQYVKRSSRRRVWKNFVRIMAYVVVFCTTYALILPAITMEYRNTCGLDEHTHSETCYSQTTNTELVCTLLELDEHTHSDECYMDVGHTHSDGCYSDSEPICGQQDVGHAHTDECYSEPELICGQEEAPEERVLVCGIAEIPAEQAHRHTDACMSTSTVETLVCPMEEHTHTLSCHSDPEADLETAEDWEKTMDDVELIGVWADDLIAIAKSQIGYTESKKNYLTEDEETKQGYTRYGAWYGVPYGGWDAMFVSFCLNYAGIPVEAVPHASSAEKWAQELDELKLLEMAADRTPQPGDLIFFADETGKITGVEIVTGLDTDQIRTIGGDRDNEVGKGKYDASDASIAAYCGMDKALKRFVEQYPEEAEALGLLNDGTQSEQVTQTAETKNYLVTVTYSADLVMPEGAELRVKEYDKDSEIFRQRCAEAGYELEWLLNIGFFVGEEELDLDGAFDVVVTSKKGDTLGSDITHFTDEGVELIAGEENEVEADEGQTAVSFSSSGFSDFGGGSASHHHSWTASGVTRRPTCSDPGTSVTYTCSCGDSMTIDPAALMDRVQTYADYLRTQNIKQDYSKGGFSWDTEQKPKTWIYYNGVMLDAFMRVGSDDMVAYVSEVYDDTLDVLASQYTAGEVDSVPMALALFDLLGSNDAVLNADYVDAIEYVFDQLWNKQTSLGEEYGGNYHHKMKGDSWNTWKFGLDGIYMALPFLMEYANALDEGLLTNNTVTSASIYNTVYSRLDWVATTMYDEYTGLYHHGWNGRQGNGQFWGRGIGWYAVALTDIIDMMPPGYRPQLKANLTKLFDGMLRWQDDETGMWYNVVNEDSSLTANNNSNMLETSVSSMMAYAMIKAYREGWVDVKYYEAGLRALNGVVSNKMTGTTSVKDTYKSSGVCTTPEDYLKNPYTVDEAKGVGALILAVAPEHNWSEWTVASSNARATTGDVTETRTCEDCGEVQSRAVDSGPKTVVGYTFTTLDPNQLEDGDIVAIYCRPNGWNQPNVTFAMSDHDVAAKTINSNREWEPVTIDATWDLTLEQMGSSIEAFTWKVEKEGNTVRFASESYDDSQYAGPEYLCIPDWNGAAVQTWNSTGHVGFTLQGVNGAGFRLRNTYQYTVNYQSEYREVSYSQGDARFGYATGSGGTTLYFASVTPKMGTATVTPTHNYPKAVQTGEISVDTPRFYNFAADEDGNISTLAGCTFVIKNSAGTIVATLTSTEAMEILLPDLPNGTYTIEETSAAEGYIRDVNPERTFAIRNQVFDDDQTIGRYVNYKNNLLEADKVAEVEDYNNRTYQIMMTAESNLRLYEMDPVDVLFVVDKSNSMLFPAGLNEVKENGAAVTVTFSTSDTATTSPNKNSNAYKQLDALRNREVLKDDQLYYIIAEQGTTSTVFAIWRNGEHWMFQDASYYAKAYYENRPGYRQDDEMAVFPTPGAFSSNKTSDKQNVTYIKNFNSDGTPNYVTEQWQVKSNGGSVGCSLGTKGAIYNDCNNNNGSYTYTIYEATNTYNRLHYLQDSLAHSIRQLSDANDESTVTLIRFNREVDPTECIGPVTLTPDNVEKLVEKVSNIHTDGGTRQDIALEHAYAHLNGTANSKDLDENVITGKQFNKPANKTYTVLITDGAPVLGNSDKNLQLGNKDSAKSIDGTVYGRIKYWGDKVGINTYRDGIDKSKDDVADGDQQSILMTIGLGMGAAEGGAQVLKWIATDPLSAHHRIIDDAEQLMEMLEQLLYATLQPREKVDLKADISDVISDSFYPIAWIEKGGTVPSGRKLDMQGSNTDGKTWIILEEDDWITCEGQYVGTEQNPKDSTIFGTGQLTINDGDYQIKWDDQMIYDCELVWVPTLDEVPYKNGTNQKRTVVMTEEHVKVGDTTSKVGRYWFKLEVGDYIFAHGEYARYYPNRPQGQKYNKNGTFDYGFAKGTYKIVGKYVKDPNNPRPHIDWNIDLNNDGKPDSDYYSIDFDASFQPYLWHGKFYVKAKEDFIGGNAIDTNKSAQVAAQENDGDNIEEVIRTIYLETPTVNVRLLDMNQMQSEVTVYLGDMINGADGDLASPLGTLQDFFNRTYIKKIEKDLGGKSAVMNMVDAASKDGLGTDEFSIEYALGGLTDDQWSGLWKTLTTYDFEKQVYTPVTMEYTYDDASSHGPVGYFTFRLEKTGTDSSYYAHEAEHDCGDQHVHDKCTEPVETYILHVTYTAYKLGEEGRPTATVHNDVNDIDGDNTEKIPDTDVTRSGVNNGGIEVGGAYAGPDLPDGYGIVDKDDIHRVHVISGKIEVIKEITADLVSQEEQTFTFTLTHQESGSTVPLKVKVKAGETSGSASVDQLKRGTWVLTEDGSENYTLQSLTILYDVTNTSYYSNQTQAIFHMGFDWQSEAAEEKGAVIDANGEITWPDENVIGKADKADLYTSYINSPNGVYGAAKAVNTAPVYKGEIPVEKHWFDGVENHSDDSVLLILYENVNGVDYPVMVDGKIQYLYLDAGDSVKVGDKEYWKGTFQVFLSHSGDTVEKHGYTVREALVVEMTKEEYDPATDDVKAKYVELYDSDRETYFYAEPRNGDGILGTWFVQYGKKQETTSDGTTETVLTVTNSPARELPESGGMGTHMYTFSGLLCLIAAALMYGYNQRRKHEGRGE